MANRKQRRHPAKPRGITFADELQRQRMIKEMAVETAKDKMVKVQTEIRVQKVLWLTHLALNDEFNFGPVSFDRFDSALIRRSEWYEDLVKGGDEEYADEKLRQEVERVARTKVTYAYEEQINAAKKAQVWQPENLYERIRMMDIDQLARFITEEVLGLDGPMQELEESRWKRKLREREAKHDQ